MKRWTRSLPFLLTNPVIIVACALLRCLSQDPSTQIMIEGAGCALSVILTPLQMIYIELRDKEAFIPFSGILLFSWGLLGIIVAYVHPISLISGRDLLLVHGLLFTFIALGVSSLYDAIVLPPKQWRASYQAWRRGPTISPAV